MGTGNKRSAAAARSEAEVKKGEARIKKGEAEVKKSDARLKKEVTAKSETENTARQLLKHPNLWRAGELRQQHTSQGVASGYTELDKHLPGQGWPAAGLMEFMLHSAGVGELRLLVPALQKLSQQARWIAWVNPPFIPYAPALQSVGIDTRKILLIHPRNHQDTLWALERALKSGTCSAALAWPDERKLKLKDTQRLQLAAKQGGTLSCLLRPQSAHTQSSMAELRVALHCETPGHVQVDILKRRGGWPVHNVSVCVSKTSGAEQHSVADIQQQLSLWRTMHKPAINIAADPTAEPLIHIDQSEPATGLQVH